MSVFESGDRKEWFETALADKLVADTDGRNETEFETSVWNTLVT
jgi:hypothetical protein